MRFCAILPTNTLPQRSRRSFWCDLEKQVFMCFFANVWRHFFQPKTLGAFLIRISRHSVQISGILPRFSGLFLRLSTNENFRVHLQPSTPAFYTTGWGVPQAWTLGPPMSKMLHLIQNIIMNKTVDLFWQMFMKTYFCSMGAGFGGLSSPNKVTSAHKLNYETVQFSGLFVNL